MQGFIPTLARPEVDLLEGLTTAIIVDQERPGGNPRSTVGTVTDANAMLRIVFSRLGQLRHIRAGVPARRPRHQRGARDVGERGRGRADGRLHLADVERLLGLLDRIVDAGKSVIAITHHQAVMAHADWTIDLGPGAGADGGRVVFEGTPADLVAGWQGSKSLTGEHLAAYVSA